MELERLFRPDHEETAIEEERFEKFTTNQSKEILLKLAPAHRLWGHHVWNAGKVAANWIEEHAADLIVGKSVLEFGAASSLPSLVAARSGATFVCSTDFDDPCLVENIRFNFEHNSIPCRWSVLGYNWGGDPGELLAANSSQKYDFLVLSDLVFNHSAHHRLLKSCVDCMKADATALVTFTAHRPHLLAKDLEFFVIAREQFCLQVTRHPPVYTGVMFDKDRGDEETRATVHVYTLNQ